MELNSTIINAAGNGQIAAGSLVGSAAAQLGDILTRATFANGDNAAAAETFSPNDYPGATQNARIKAALALMKLRSTPTMLVLATDTVSQPNTNKWVITEAVLLGDNMGLTIDGTSATTTLKLADGIFDNVVRNAGINPDPANPNGKALSVTANRNIRILGKGDARLEGPDVPYSAPRPDTGGASVPWVGDDFGWRTCNITLANVVGLEVAGLRSVLPRAWSITLSHGVKFFWIHDMDFRSANVNGDGLDIRNGCSFGVVQRIKGITHDDLVAVCAAVPFADGSPYPMLPLGYESNPLGDDTHHITIEDISGDAGAGNMVRAFTSGAQGTSLYDITIRRVRQTSGDKCLNIGTFGAYSPPVGALRNLLVEDIVAETAPVAVQMTARLQDAVFNRITTLVTTAQPISWSNFNRDGSVRVSQTDIRTGLGPGIKEQSSLYLGQIATASRIANTFNATNKQSMSTTRHIKRGSSPTMRLVYWNGYVNTANPTTEETSRGSTATYKVSLEYPIGTTPRLFTWASANQITANDGAIVMTDEMSFDVPDGAAYYLHCYQTATAGIVYTTYPTTHQGGVIEGMTFGASGIADATTTVGGDAARSASNEFATPPLAILGYTRCDAVGIYGDSRAAGTGSPGDTGDFTTNTGTYARSIGKSLAYINLGVPSGRALGLKSSNTVRLAMLKYVTAATVALGVNDYRTNGDSATTIYNNLQLIANAMLTAKPSLRLFFGTIEPYTTASTDAYATSGSQTPHAQDATRIGVNDTLRLRGVVGAAGILDIASVLESGLNTGFWKGGSNGATSYPITSDGLHSTQRGCLLVEQSSIITPGLFARA